MQMARVLVAYASRLGATREIARRIGEVLRTADHDVTVQSVDDAVDAGAFDAVVVGSGVFAGHWHRPAIEFVRRHGRELASRPTWLFSSGPVGSIALDSAPKDPADIADLSGLVKPRGHRVFFGALDRAAVEGSDLSRFERVIAKRFVPEGDWRDWAAIEAWAESISDDLVRAGEPTRS
jgi:menaquinone-dependent protoporphyrinogen oxidase